VIINDARSAMTLTSKRYDAIVSQPSHPWTAGASHLYTREYMSLARSRLTDNGVYLQWMNSQFVDEFLFKSLCATMLDVFQHVRIYQWNSQVLFFLGSDSPLEVEQAMVSTNRPINDDPLGYLERGVGTVEDVIAALAMDQVNVERFAQGGEIITDNNNLMATRSAKVIGTDDVLTNTRLYQSTRDYDPLLNAQSAIRSQFPVALNYAYISRRLQIMGMRQRAIDLADDLINVDDPQALVMIAQGQEWQGQLAEAEKNYRLALQADPENQQARYALLQPRFEEILNAETVPEQYAAELRRLTGTGLTTLRARYALSKNELNEVAKLDAALARVQPSDLWYLLSVKLRADWRIQLTSPELQPRMANEAIRLIDSAIVFSPTQELHAMRLEAALVAKDIPSVLETARRLIYLMDKEINLQKESSVSVSNPILRGRMKRIVRVKKLLEGLADDTQVSSDKLEALLESATSTIEALSQLDGY